MKSAVVQIPRNLSSVVHQNSLSELRSSRSIFQHDGNSARPHVELSSKEHSGGYFNGEVISDDPYMLDSAAYRIIKFLRGDDEFPFNEVDRVMGPAMGAVRFASILALHISRQRGRRCLSGYVEKDPVKGGRVCLNKTRIKKGERILLCDDALTTGKSVLATRDAVLEAGGVVLPYVVTLFNRSGLWSFGDLWCIALVEYYIPRWSADECRLCPQGSEPLRPEEGNNWERLFAHYE